MTTNNLLPYATLTYKHTTTTTTIKFDLDACFWDQEMYEMPALPSRTVLGDLLPKDEELDCPAGEGGQQQQQQERQGVTGVYSGSHCISMHSGSLRAMQEHARGELYPGMKVCFASSADTQFAEQIGRATLKLLEVLPGMTVWDIVFQRDWDSVDVNQIGRRPPLSSNKAQTHFPRLKAATGISYDRMLFFDDCNWGDHCGMVARQCREANGKGVVTHRTPYGLKVSDWYKGLELYRQAHRTE